MTDLYARIAELAAKYRPLAVEMLKEVIRIPADYVADNPKCGLSNGEKERLTYLKNKIVEIGAVRNAKDVDFDGFGNLVWTVEDVNDGIPASEKKIIYLDGHSDTVGALRDQWLSKIGGGIDCYDGLIDKSKVNKDFLKTQLGYMPPEDQWDDNVIFGRGSADQLGGVISEAIATKILLELCSEGALKGAIVRAYATACEEDNDGGGPLYVVREVLPGAAPEIIPDVVILTEGTGDSRPESYGALGIYRGQRGRLQIEVKITGKSCHGSMPWEGKNPLEAGGAILKEAAEKYEKRIGFKDDAFLGHGTRTASWSKLETPSDCAVPDRFTFRFDRRMTVGETPEQSLADVEALDSVKEARAKGFQVEISVPTYDEASWRGYKLHNPQFYRSWVTPEDHVAIQAAVAAYKGAISPSITPELEKNSGLRKEPRVQRWIFSTDGVGYVIPKDDKSFELPDAKKWVRTEHYKHPAMFGIGPGFEQNTHKIGECMDTRELQHAIAFLAAFPSTFVKMSK